MSGGVETRKCHGKLTSLLVPPQGDKLYRAASPNDPHAIAILRGKTEVILSFPKLADMTPLFESLVRSLAAVLA